MATVSRDDALWALKKADWFQLSWGHHPATGPDRWCAAAHLMLRKYGPSAFMLREDLYFPTDERLAEAHDALAQLANWAEILGFVHRFHSDMTVMDVYVFDQEKVSAKARAGETGHK